jgi:hypothetical protein
MNEGETDLSDEAIGRIADYFEKALKQTCGNCGQTCETDLKFCPYCGVENSEFDEAEFQRFVGFSLAEAKAEYCDVGHPGRQQAERDHPEMVYCFYCGEKLF